MVEKNSTNLTLMSWNIKSGGFNSYDPSLTIPERENDIRTIIDDAHGNRGVNAVTLIDAYRWDEVYGDDQDIAHHIGYADARFVRLHDERLERDNGSGIGIAFGTDIIIEQSRPLDLETRCGLGVILAIGHYGLQVANVYLDDLSEEVRLKQIKALINDLEPDIPTVLVGDFNMLRPEMSGASFENRAKDLALRSLTRILPRRGLGATIIDMNKRQGVPLIESLGFNDADRRKKQPTAPSRLPIFGVDYVFHDNKVRVDSMDVISTKKSSDHAAIVVDLRL